MNAIRQMELDGLSEEVLDDIAAEEEARRARRERFVWGTIEWTVFLVILALVLGLAGNGPSLSGTALDHIRIIPPH